MQKGGMNGDQRALMLTLYALFLVAGFTLGNVYHPAMGPFGLIAILLCPFMGWLDARAGRSRLPLE